MRHHDDTTFLQRTGAGAKKHAGTAIVAVLASTLTGTVVPMLEQWHSDKQISDEIAEVRVDSGKALDYVQQQHEKDLQRMTDENSKLWKYIQDDEQAMARHGIVPNHH